MNRTSQRVAAAALAIMVFVVAEVIKDAAVYGLAQPVISTLAIVAGVLGLILNYLPSIFHGDSTTSTTTETTTVVTPPKPADQP